MTFTPKMLVGALLVFLLVLPAISAPSARAGTIQPAEPNDEIELMMEVVASLPLEHRVAVRACARKCARRFKTNKLQVLCYKAISCADTLTSKTQEKKERCPAVTAQR